MESYDLFVHYTTQKRDWQQVSGREFNRVLDNRFFLLYN